MKVLLFALIKSQSFCMLVGLYTCLFLMSSPALGCPFTSEGININPAPSQPAHMHRSDPAVLRWSWLLLGSALVGRSHGQLSGQPELAVRCSESGSAVVLSCAFKPSSRFSCASVMYLFWEVCWKCFFSPHCFYLVTLFDATCKSFFFLGWGEGGWWCESFWRNSLLPSVTQQWRCCPVLFFFQIFFF